MKLGESSAQAAQPCHVTVHLVEDGYSNSGEWQVLLDGKYECSLADERDANRYAAGLRAELGEGYYSAEQVLRAIHAEGIGRDVNDGRKANAEWWGDFAGCILARLSHPKGEQHG